MKMDPKTRKRLRKEKTVVNDSEKRPYCQIFRAVSRNLLKISLFIILGSFAYMFHFLRTSDEEDQAEYFECL